MIGIGTVFNTGILVNHLIEFGRTSETLAQFRAFTGGARWVTLLALEIRSDVIANGRAGINASSKCKKKKTIYIYLTYDLKKEINVKLPVEREFRTENFASWGRFGCDLWRGAVSNWLTAGSLEEIWKTRIGVERRSETGGTGEKEGSSRRLHSADVSKSWCKRRNDWSSQSVNISTYSRSGRWGDDWNLYRTRNTRSNRRRTQSYRVRVRSVEHQLPFFQNSLR